MTQSLTQRLTAALVEDAEIAIRPLLPPSRLLQVQDSSAGRRIFLKLECEQPTGSFKVRGAVSNLVRLPAMSRGFVTASAGNHGLGVAWAAKECHRAEGVTIFVPSSTPEPKLRKLREYEIDLRIGGQTFDDAERAAHIFEGDTGAHFIHAYDDPLTAAGQGTMAIEIAATLGSVGTMVVPVGGGGMISGIAAWIKERRPETRVVAVQPDASPSLSESIRLDRPLLEYAAGPTLADGLAGGIGRIVFSHRDLIDQVVNVPEDRIRAAVRRLHLDHGVRAEASGAIAYAAIGMSESADWPSPLVCVVTGGNIDNAVFEGLVG